MRRPHLPGRVRRRRAARDRGRRRRGARGLRAGRASAGLVRATEEAARWVSGQIELAELARARTRAVEAELRALRAQISPHFIYNSLAAIASFVRTDPERARELLLEFADFTRYAFRLEGRVHDAGRRAAQHRALPRSGAGPVRRPARGLAADRARGAARRRAVPVPAAAGRERRPARPGATTAPGTDHDHAEDDDTEAGISVEDNGVGSDPEVVRRALAGDDADTDAVGLANVDARLRQVYGDEYGLVVETALGAGTKVSFRVPKFAPGVRCVSHRAALRALVVDDEGPALESWPSCSPRRAGRRGAHAALRRGGPAAAARATRSTWSSATSRCPGSTGSTWPGAEPFARPPRWSS